MRTRYPVTSWDPNNAPVPEAFRNKLYPYDFHGEAFYCMEQIDLLVQQYKLHEIIKMISPIFDLSDTYFWINPVTNELESFSDCGAMEPYREKYRHRSDEDDPVS